MRRTTLNEKQRALAVLVGLGQFSYQDIAKMVGIHYNSVTNWLKDKRIQALVSELQQGIQDKLEGGAIESVCYKNTLLLGKAIKKLEEMLESKSQKKQLEVIKLLLEYGTLPGVVQHEQALAPHGERPSLIRLERRPGPTS